jgi:dipeptidyl aminopeptidase/acylaminoacyl peptidase
MRLLLALLFFFALGNGSEILAQTPANRSKLSIEQIMQGDRFVGFLPEDVHWAEDNSALYFTWNPNMAPLRSQYKVELKGGQPQEVSIEEQKNLPDPGVYNKAGSLLLYEKNGDIFLLDKSTGQSRHLTNTVDRESNPIFSGDEAAIIFTKDNNLYTWEFAGGALRQLTNLRRGNKRVEPGVGAQEQWLRNDQLEWMEVLQQRKETRELREQRNKTLDPQRPREIYYGEKQLSNLQCSPDLRFVTYRLSSRNNSKGTAVPDYVTESGYTEELNARAKVGGTQDLLELFIYDIARDTYYVVDTKLIDGIYDKPAFLREYHKDTTAYATRYSQPRETIIHGPFFSADGKAAVVVRALDNKDRWIMLLDLPSGQFKHLDRQHDDAWIGGPGIDGWLNSAGTIGWLPDNRRLWFQSEDSGYSHLYTIDIENGEKKALTSGRFEVLSVQLSRDGNYFYLSANAEGPHERHFYRLPTAGGALERITRQAGAHDVTLSPDESLLAVRYSYSNRPWELYVMDNRPGAPMRQLTTSTTEAFKAYKWREPEIVWIPAADGARVPARLYRPTTGARKGPAVIFVHGAGYLQNVHKWWSTYFREYMFHNYLADNGYTVLDIDYRASSGYGRDWRTAIYRHMGGKDLSDQVDGARYLARNHGVDPRRIGIYGGSYGGFITLMALFNAPETFRCGAALRSVADWAHYNHPYTANILNTPTADSIAYRRSSPIYFAEGLQGRLLMLHGMVDTNVHFQDVVRLSQRLIELGKNNWEMAIFPMEDHGFVEPSSWADEYKRIYRLFEEELK